MEAVINPREIAGRNPASISSTKQGIDGWVSGGAAGIRNTFVNWRAEGTDRKDKSRQERYYQGTRKSLAALALLADKLKSHGQILTKITYILSRLCMENVGKGI